MCIAPYSRFVVLLQAALPIDPHHGSAGVFPFACCREPLAPVEAGDWDRSCLQGLRRWEAGNAPFTAVAGLQAPPPAVPPAVALAGSAALGGLALDSQALSALRAICGARRGLIVAAELSQPEDVVAAAQLSELLGWPVAADLLSGLRAGVPSSGARSPSGAAVIHHFDHLLLLDRQQWEQLRPDVVLQLGGHLTSKRVTQFLEWCCTSSAGTGDGSRQSALDDTQQQQLTWIMAASSPKRHDQLHLLSHRLQAPLPMLAAALAAQLAAGGATLSSGRTQPAARQQQRQQQQVQQQRYSALLQLLDAEASAAVDAALAAMPELSEPQVARTLSQLLPPGKQLRLVRSCDHSLSMQLLWTKASGPQAEACVSVTFRCMLCCRRRAVCWEQYADSGPEHVCLPSPRNTGQGSFRQRQ